MSVPDDRTTERVAVWSALADREPTHARAAGVDLVVIRYEGNVSVLYGRCLHRGVLLGDGSVEGENLICGVHGWDYRYDAVSVIRRRTESRATYCLPCPPYLDKPEHPPKHLLTIA